MLDSGVSTEQACGDMLVALLSIALLYAFLHVALPLPRTGGPEGAFVISQDFGSSLFICLLLFALYFSSFLSLRGTLEERWHGWTKYSHAACAIHVAENVQTSLLYPAMGKEAVFYAHHALVIAGYGTAVLSGRAHFWCAAAGLTEGTNVFLFAIISGSHLGWPPLAKGGVVHTASGALLWLSFTILRLSLLPWALYAYVQDALLQPDVWRQLPFVLQYLQWPSGAIIVGLSALWYVKISKGVLKALGVGVGGDDEGTAPRKRE